MKKVFFFLLASIALSAQAQTVDEIIKKYADNLGGLEAFNKVKTVKFTGSLNVSGNDLPMTIQTINGVATRTDLEAMGQQVIRAYKGGKGWTVNPFAGITKPTEMTGADLADIKAQSMLASALMDYKSRGHQVELAGQADVEGIKTFKIKLTSKDDNRVTYYYISTTDYNLIKSETDRDIQGQSTTIESFYSDLKEFNGLKFYMNREAKMNGETFQTVSLSTVEFGVTIDEKIFEMPK